MHFVCLKCTVNTTVDICRDFGITLFHNCCTCAYEGNQEDGDTEETQFLLNEGGSADPTPTPDSGNRISVCGSSEGDHKQKHSINGEPFDLRSKTPVESTITKGKVLQPSSCDASGELSSSQSVDVAISIDTTQDSADHSAIKAQEKQKNGLSITSICVPPPLTSLFRCCPFCCCSRRSLYQLKVYWLWCFPILFTSSTETTGGTESTGTSGSPENTEPIDLGPTADSAFCKFFYICCWLAGFCFCKCHCEHCNCWWCSACCIPCCTPLSSDDLETSEEKPCCNTCIKACKWCVNHREGFTRCMNEKPWKKCGDCWENCWTVFTNITSLIVYLAFVSYLSQAFPAIVISYYLNPTASLIRLGFIEVIIVIMLTEVSYLLFLLDKFTWLCYYNRHKKMPQEIIEIDNENKANDKNIEQTTFISQYIDDKGLIYSDYCQCKNSCYYPSKCICKSCQVTCHPVKCCEEIKDCHWLFGLTCIQIFTMLFITILSAILLFFLLNVVIQETSGSNNQFKDILAIVPTIVLNLWLVFRQGDFCKAVKNINKALGDPLSTAENGHHHM